MTTRRCWNRAKLSKAASADLLVTPWSRLRQSLLHDPQAEQDFSYPSRSGRPLCGVA